MSSITSSTYPVVEGSQAGDQYTIVRSGSLKKQTRAGIADYIKGQTLTAVRNGGATLNRPESPATFEFYFDTTIGKPIWYDGAQWVDAAGAVI